MNLTDDQKKMLTEKLLGEVYHNVEIAFHDGMISKCSCGARGCIARFECEKNNRTFLTDTDMMDCKRALVKEKKWADFWDWAELLYMGSDDYEGILDYAFACWLFNPTDDEGAHFCRLVAEFMEKAT